jgi:copper chaperone CopZ
MRSVAYAVAILAAAGIMYFVATSGPTETPETASQTPPATVDTDAEVKTASLKLNVPEMHCPFACYPSVKENLEKQDDVLTVELAPQKEEGVIDNPQVIVTYKDGSDPDQMIAVLDAAGFAGSTVAAE